MAEEFRYASAAGDSHKRKYDDSPSPVARRGTGFSLAPDAAAPLPSYGSVPPPMNEIELAKQKAQEIAARLLNNADPTKRARVENGGGGFDSSDYGGPKTFGLGHSNPPPMASSGYPGSKKIEIPNGRVGVIIGKGGETIKYLQQQSGAKIQVTRDTDSDPNSTTRGVELMGTPDQIARAEQLITDVLAEAEAGSSGGGSRRVSGQLPGAEQFVMKVPNNKVGLVIGKGGETIKNMQARTGARIQVIPLHLPPGDTSNERTVQIDGTSEQIEAAKQLVEEVISENRMRNSSMSGGGGYRQQGGYQARPPTNWGQPPPMQQPGYSYTQTGPYPGQNPQYPPMNQPPYPGYPPQPTSAGYATGWDQSSAPTNPAPGSTTTYDYYNQQQQPPPQQQQQQPHGTQGAPDASGYTYGPQYGYGQDGYGGGYHTGYGQPQSNPASGYDQQQQGYNSAYGSTTASNPPSDGNNNPPSSYPSAAQGEATQGYGGVPPPSSQGGYGTQPPTGYGNYGQQQPPPQGQKPQQSPQSAGGYSHPSGGGGGYAAAYGGQTYPGGYGQQQYGGYYGGGYSQQQAYSGDAAAAASGGGYEGGAPPPAAAASQPAAETSPPN